MELGSVEVEEAKLEVAKQEVLSEIKEEANRRGQSEGEAFNDYLNNFWVKLPDKKFPEGSQLAHQMTFAKMDLDITNRQSHEDFVKRMKEGGTAISEEDSGSELFQNQTSREFFATVEKALEKEGVSIEELSSLQRNMEESWYHIGKLNRLVFPTYVRLRAMGYNWNDLSG